MQEQEMIQYYATLGFGSKPVMKMVFAISEEDAIKTIHETYPEAYIISLLSIDDVIEIGKDVQLGNVFHVVETIKESNGSIKFKNHKEKNVSVEQLQVKYENRNCIILSPKELSSMLESLKKWTIEHSQNELPLLSKSLNYNK